MVGAYLHGATSPGSCTGRMAALVGIHPAEGTSLDDATAAAARELGDKIAMHVVAMRPPYLDRASGAILHLCICNLAIDVGLELLVHTT